MATTGKSTANNKRTTTTSSSSSSSSKNTSQPRANTAPRSDASQVREGVTKARHGAVSIVVQGAERAVDLPVGAALTVRDRVTDVVEPWTSGTGRERELKSLRTQVTRELNKIERRGGQARRKASQRARTTRTRVERDLKARRRDLEGTVKRAQSAVQERVPTGA